MKFSQRRNKPENDAKTGSFSLPADDDEPDFPRGGRSFLSREEEEEVRAEVDAEFKAEGRDAKKRKKRVLRTSPSEEDLGFLFGGTLTGKLPRFANRITLKNISPGMKLLGVVIEINPKDLVISLPGGLRGFVRAEEALDLVSEYGFKDLEGTTLCNTFVVGQLVSSIVLHVDDDKKDGKGNKKIWLSLRLALLHKGLSLDSIQDGMEAGIEKRPIVCYYNAPERLSSFGVLTREEETIWV
ncbi:rRNA biogenesis protein rrp5 [Asimina triloba]